MYPMPSTLLGGMVLFGFFYSTGSKSPVANTSRIVQDQQGTPGERKPKVHQVYQLKPTREHRQNSLQSSTLSERKKGGIIQHIIKFTPTNPIETRPFFFPPDILCGHNTSRQQPHTNYLRPVHNGKDRKREEKHNLRIQNSIEVSTCKVQAEVKTTVD
ncbi:uncharacterized protein GGS22DRAFT_136790 [Annulohypoxylon maeteangense]|uniref:uncharacterized protein n=1 Tax=Annulohypoxylon maeteangense TaxID=1927788 RepID=UPI0020086CBF|nr:uncharacterized protein GGS22DRAFT_136790 [Annulohypoxylon maeteangense]KAI0884975.1 hypothetical protein GGS22DRAFT_136790 [Annulohypoxylon maeteangense]